MTFRPSRSTANRAAVLVLSAVALSLAACASAGSTGSEGLGRCAAQRERAGFVVASPALLSEAVSPLERRDDPGRCRAPRTSAALDPCGPWVGTIGVKSHVPNSYEYGVGLCVPNLAGSRVEQPIAPDPIRSVGLGVWLKFDF